MTQVGPLATSSEEKRFSMKSASFDDHCSRCGRVMLDTEGSLDPVPYAVCDDCLKKRKPQDHVVPFPQPVKESVMKIWKRPYFFGQVLVDGIVRICKRMTAESPFEIVSEEEKALIHAEAEAAPMRHSDCKATSQAPTSQERSGSRLTEQFNSLPLIEQLRAHVVAAESTTGEARTRALQACATLRGKIAAQAAETEAKKDPLVRYLAALDIYDTETAAKIAHDHPDAIVKASRATPPSDVQPDTFVAKTCAIPGCGQGFVTKQNSGRLLCDEHIHTPKPDPVAAPVGADVVGGIRKPLGRPTEAGPDSNETRGDKMSRFVPEQGLVSAALPNAGAGGSTRQIVGDSFAGHGENRPDETGLLADPEYKKARAAGDTAEMARIAHAFGRKKS